MVSAGIGGATIAEAKQSLTMDEAWEWKRYRDKHGTLNTNYLIDRGFAMLAHFVCIAHGIKIGNDIPTMQELMFHPKKEDEVCVNVQDAFGFLKGLKSNGK